GALHGGHRRGAVVHDGARHDAQRGRGRQQQRGRALALAALDARARLGDDGGRGLHARRRLDAPGPAALGLAPEAPAERQQDARPRRQGHLARAQAHRVPRAAVLGEGGGRGQLRV
ncbi:hypothetical protein EG859_15495, partial [Enterococcus faecalis]